MSDPIALSSTSKYCRFLVSVDCVVFRIANDQLEVLLIKRGQEPFLDMWALPGGFVEQQETVEQAASRELKEETGISPLYLEQCNVYSDPKRDPRGQVVSVSFYSLLNQEMSTEFEALSPTRDASDAKWVSLSKCPKLAFDHSKIIQDAYIKLKETMRRKPVAFEFLPNKFPLSQLQRVYEIVYMTDLDKRNFRKKIIRAGIVESTQESQQGVSHRAAQLYKQSKLGNSADFFFDL